MDTKLSKYAAVNSNTNALTRSVIDLFNAKGHKVWRNNSGQGYGTSVVAKAIELLKKKQVRTAYQVLTSTRPIDFGLKGSSDIIGFTNKGIGIYIEIKVGRDKVSPAQQNFLEVAKSCNCVAFVCHSYEDALDAIKKIE